MTQQTPSPNKRWEPRVVQGNAEPSAPSSPSDLHAEAAVLSAVLLDPNRYDAVATMVQESDFYRQEHRWIWQAICELRQADQKVDLVTVRGWLTDHEKRRPMGSWITLLTRLVDYTPAIEHVEEHARRVVDKARLRQLGDLGARWAIEVCGDTGPTELFFDRAEQQMREITDRASGEESGVTVGGSLQRIFERLHHPELEPEPCSTGFASIDALTTGLRPGELWLVAARPGAGKTAFALSVATHVARQAQGVVVFSLEMPADQLTLRCLSAQSGIGLSKLRSLQIYPGDWPNLVAASTALAQSPLWIEEDMNVTVFDLRSRARRQANRWARKNPAIGLRVIVVDYLQLVRPTSTKMPRDQQVGEISAGLKLLSRELGVTVIACVQMNRDIESRGGEPRLSDLRESGRLEQDADLVAFLCGGEQLKGLGENEMGLYVAKQRNGPRGRVKLQWDPETVRFSE